MSVTFRSVFSRKLTNPVPLLRRFNLDISLRTKENPENKNVPSVSKKADAFDNLLKGINLKKLNQGLRKDARIIVGVTDLLPVTKPRNSININKIIKFKTDQVCDQKVVQCLKELDFNKALETLKFYHGVNRYPSQKTCMTLLQISLKNLNLEGIEEVKKIINKAYPQEYQWQMGYEHYVAEYHWKKGNYTKATEIFENLFAHFPQRRKKLTDMLQFMARKIINDESEDEVKKLVQFVISLIHKHSTHHPAINVWFLLFLSEKGTYHNLCPTILGITPEKTAPFVINKIDSILRMAEEKNNIDYNQRLVESILFLQAKSEYTKVFGSLLEHQCKMGDLKMAQETFKYCNNEKIILSGTSISEYSKLFKRSSNKTKDLGVSIKNPNKEYNFKF